jgi:hypothetical protein
MAVLGFSFGASAASMPEIIGETKIYQIKSGFSEMVFPTASAPLATYGFIATKTF